MKDFLKRMFTPNSGVSSKRVCGALGWITALLISIYCAIKVIQAPDITEIVIWASMLLLGVDSVTQIWKKN